MKQNKTMYLIQHTNMIEHELTKFEYVVIEMMKISVSLSYGLKPEYLSDNVAKEHVQAAIRLTHTIFAELENEKKMR